MYGSTDFKHFKQKDVKNWSSEEGFGLEHSVNHTTSDDSLSTERIQQREHLCRSYLNGILLCRNPKTFSTQK